MALDAGKILHDHLYGRPEHPVPDGTRVADLEYAPREGSVGVRAQSAGDGIVRLTVSACAADVDDLLESARRSLVRDMEGDPDDPDSVAHVQQEMGEARFIESVENIARTYLLSAAILRTWVFPLLPADLSDARRIRAGRDYSFTARFPVLPRGELSAYDRVELKLREQPSVSQGVVNEYLKGIIERGRKAGIEIPAEGSDDYEQLRELARQEAEQDTAQDWFDQAMESCATKLSERLTAEPNERAVSMLRNEMLNDIAENMQHRGISWEQYTRMPGFDLEQMRASLTEQATSTLRLNMAVDAMADHVGIMIKLRDILEAVGADPAGGEAQVADALTTMMQTGQLPQMCQLVRRFKTKGMLARQVINAATEDEVARIADEVAAGGEDLQAQMEPGIAAAAQRVSPFAPKDGEPQL